MPTPGAALLLSGTVPDKPLLGQTMARDPTPSGPAAAQRDPDGTMCHRWAPRRLLGHTAHGATPGSSGGTLCCQGHRTPLKCSRRARAETPHLTTTCWTPSMHQARGAEETQPWPQILPSNAWGSHFPTGPHFPVVPSLPTLSPRKPHRAHPHTGVLTSPAGFQGEDQLP